MKLTVIAMTFLLFATQAIGACFPNPNSSFANFMKRLVNEHEYYGKGTIVETPSDGRPSRTYHQTGSYFFSRLQKTFLIQTEMCDGVECQQGEERWTMRAGCLYVQGVRARITRSTFNELRFTLVRGDMTMRAQYLLSPGRRLTVNVGVNAPAGTLSSTFSGTGM